MATIYHLVALWTHHCRTIVPFISWVDLDRQKSVPFHGVTTVHIAMIRLLLARLARLTKAQPPLLVLRGEASLVAVAA